MTEHRKKIKHYHEPGDLHELTFSCYLRMSLLSSDLWKKWFCQSIDRACDRGSFGLVAFVIMPEHTHLLVDPYAYPVSIGDLLKTIKGPFSVRVKRALQRDHDPLLSRLTVKERPGKLAFRYWQEGPGYDRNVSGERDAMNVINYIHMNPVRRGLVSRASEWKWSSARWYESDGKHVDPDLPKIHGLRWGFFES
jgi:putative transposase